MLPPTLIGDVVERSTNSKKLKPPSTSGSGSSTGFPTAKHRSQSAFARARQARGASGSESSDNARVVEVPKVVPFRPSQSTSSSKPEPERSHISDSGPSSSAARDATWRTEMERQNAEMVAQMSDDERGRHASEILDQLGPNMSELVQKVKKAREGREAAALGRAADGHQGKHTLVNRDSWLCLSYYLLVC